MTTQEVYLVLGGDVFVGRHVVERLLARGDHVAVFDSTEQYSDVPYYIGDIRVLDEIHDAIQKSGATCIIHTISPLSVRNRDNTQIFFDVNVEGTRNVIRAATAAGVRKLVYHGSAGVVFDGSDIVNGDETLPYPLKHLDPYTASRAGAEQLVLTENGKHGLQTAVIRPAGIFGQVINPGDQELIVGAYDSWKRNMTNIQLGNNKNLHDKTYVGNIALAILLASDKLHTPSGSSEVAGQCFFITNNDPRPFWDFMRALWSGFDDIFPDPPRVQQRQVVFPRMLVFFLAYVMVVLGWLKNQKEQTLTPYTVTFATATMYFSSEKAKKVLGYVPEVGVDEGIQKTIEWFKSQNGTSKPSKLSF